MQIKNRAFFLSKILYFQGVWLLEVHVVLLISTPCAPSFDVAW